MGKLRYVAVVLVVATASFISSAGATVSPRFVTSIAYRVKLGSTVATNYALGITQSPTSNDVYFAEGKKVLVVKGHAAPIRFVTAPAKVLALCATAGDLYAQTATSVREYTLPGGHLVGSWGLPSGLAGATSAGMAVEGDHLWTWVDWATDESGYEYGAVVQYNTTTWSHKVFDKGSVDPGDAAADAGGYFFLAASRVVRIEPNGRVLESSRTSDASDAPVAALGSSVYFVATREPRGNDYLDTYTISTMARRSSKAVRTSTYGLLGTPSGLIGIYGGSSHSPSSVVLIDPATGQESHALRVSGAASLLYGTTLSAVVEIHGEMYLERLV